ncbi:prenyltransferase [Salarchaeum sp. JOR-1]|uniref:prenyltransferase n=1 Tax=Salarchaeum sp. JOR-1 TaxID=2599399 RepID=UPI001198C600|nr:prenyltransferase [Salarchaeum sp. JOR-1]QDX40621.1 prenyltransferase [Salarchaeum sp. JOR-1]
MDFRYLLTLSRPRFWLYLAGPVLVGATYAATGLSDLTSPVVLALAAYFLVPANVFLYGVNDVFDRDVDEHNPKKDEKEARYRGSRDALVAVAATGVLGLGTFAVTPAVAWPWLAGFFALAVGYSAPPVRFKTTPLLDSASNGLYVLPGAAAYAALAGHHPPLLAVVGGWLWTMGMHTFSAIPDIVPDREAGIRTTATWLGEPKTYAYCVAVWTLAALAFAALDLRLLAVFAIYPAFCAWVARSAVSVERAYWWFPYLNGLAGMTLTLAGLWRLYG